MENMPDTGPGGPFAGRLTNQFPHLLVFLEAQGARTSGQKSAQIIVFGFLDGDILGRRFFLSAPG